MVNKKSCLVIMLNNYIDIDDRLEKLLTILEKNERYYAEDAVVHYSGDESKNLYVVKEGWFISYTDLYDGRRMVIKTHHPGDIIGFEGIYHEQPADLKSTTAGVLCPFSKQNLDEIFRCSPKLSALLFSISVREQIVATDRLKAVSRMGAQARLAYFLLDLIFRLRITNSSMTNEFHLPLTQTEIGDSIGLTNVSVSRAFSYLVGMQLVKRTNASIKLLDELSLMKLCDYEDRYTKMDTSWFPCD